MVTDATVSFETFHHRRQTWTLSVNEMSHGSILRGHKAAIDATKSPQRDEAAAFAAFAMREERKMRGDKKSKNKKKGKKGKK